MKREDIYILRRKSQAHLQSLLFYLCRLFPIKKNLISVCTFEGKGGFGCNPKYIVQELHKRNSDYEFVWFVNDMNKQFPEYIKKVPNTAWSRAYWLSRSKVWIDNYRKPYGTKKRRGQYYLNTWHGMVGFKTIGLWRGDAFSRMAYIVSKNDSNMVDCFLSDSKFCTFFFPKGLVYDGEIYESGSPRCDILLGDKTSIREEFRKKHGLPLECKCIMFAPTFREGSSSGKREVFSENWSIDFTRLLDNLSKRFGSEWCLCLRLHPQLSNIATDIPDVKVVNISDADDMYENLAAMDALITDYSSCAMDAELMHIPIFIYADDIGKYKTDRGEFVWEIDSDTRAFPPINHAMLPNLDVSLPFRIAHNNEELEDDIINFDESEYIQILEDYEKGVGIVIDGLAARRVADRIIKNMC